MSELTAFLREHVSPALAPLGLSARGQRFEPKPSIRRASRLYSSIRFEKYPLPGPKLNFNCVYGVISVGYAAWEVRATDPVGFVVRAPNYLWHDYLLVPGRGWRAVYDAGATRMEADWAFDPEDAADVAAVGISLARVTETEAVPLLRELQNVDALLAAVRSPAKSNQVVPAGKLAPLALLADLYPRDALEEGIRQAALKDIPYFRDFQSWARIWNDARNAS